MRGVVDEMEDMIDSIIFKQLVTIRLTRYLSRREYRNRALDIFSLDLPKDSENRTDSNSVTRRKRGYLEREKMNLLDGAAGMSRAKRWQRK